MTKQGKNAATLQFEALLRKMLSPAGDEFKVEKNAEGEDIIKFPGAEEFNWSEIRSNTNFQQLDFEDADYQAYSQYLQSGELPTAAQPNLDPAQETSYREKLYTANGAALPDRPIHFQEMQAINAYTGDFYKKINPLLSGTLDLTKRHDVVRAAIINAGFCASGLQKIPTSSPVTVYRAGRVKEQLKSAKLDDVLVFETQFASCSDTPATMEGDEFSDKQVRWTVEGVYAADVRDIAQWPGEKELLLPPGVKLKINEILFEEFDDGEKVAVDQIHFEEDGDEDVRWHIKATAVSNDKSLELSSMHRTRDFRAQVEELKTKEDKAPEPSESQSYKI